MANPKYMAYGGRGYDTKEQFYNAGEGLKVKHTAGQWRIGDAGLTVFGPPNGKPAPEVVASCRTRANASLIAAAPELLEALKHSKKVFECTGLEGEADKLSIIIAKAEGRS